MFPLSPGPRLAGLVLTLPLLYSLSPFFYGLWKRGLFFSPFDLAFFTHGEQPSTIEKRWSSPPLFLSRKV